MRLLACPWQWLSPPLRLIVPLGMLGMPWFNALQPALHANSIVPLDTDAHLARSAAVCRGTVLGNTSFKADDGHIYTRTAVRVEEVFKGVFPTTVALVHRGGVVANEGEFDSASPDFKTGEERLLFLGRRDDGTLFALQGPYSARKLTRAVATAETTGPAPFLPPDEALLQTLRGKTNNGQLAGSDVTDQATAAPARVAARVAASHGQANPPGHLLFTFGTTTYPTRATQPDQGQPIPYIVDADQLPGTLTQGQALQAVADALAAWAAVSSLKFKFEGVQSFGMAAANVAGSDGKLRIQLHDTYNYIDTMNNILGQGGAFATARTVTPGWGFGGNVAGHEFHKTARMFLVIEHTNSFFTGVNAVSNLAEIICHEVGHALGLAHSSENDTESNPTLADALMYFKAHGAGRGATLGAYDPPIIRQAHPVANTPPFSFDRVLDVVTHSSGNPPNVATINEVEARGYDLQNTPLTPAITPDPAVATPVGAWSLSGNKIKLTPDGFFANGQVADRGSGEAFDRVYFRFSDGTNASPFTEVRVVSLNEDRFPSSASDGIPDAWQQFHFGSPDPNAPPPNAKAKPGDDADNDGFTNLQEYRMGTLPNDFNHKLRFTLPSAANTNLIWLATAYELYEVQATTTLTNWVVIHPAVVPTSTVGSFNSFTNAIPHQFFRIIKVP